MRFSPRSLVDDMAVRVQQNDFDPGEELQRLAQDNTNIGGITSFLGLVRDMADDEVITSMTLEHYPGMTEKQLLKIELEARRRWPLDESLIIHRYGTLLPGDRIVLVACASSHREAAFEACNFLIDWLKTKAPFWKLESTSRGNKWVSAKASDNLASARWLDD